MRVWRNQVYAPSLKLDGFGHVGSSPTTRTIILKYFLGINTQGKTSTIELFFAV